MKYNTNNNDLNPMDKNLDKIPEILYKYRSFDSNGFGLKLAAHGEAYFASAKDFNDPFDNYFIPISKLTDLEGEKLVKFLHKKAKQLYPDADKDKIDELIEEGKKQNQRFKEGNSKAIEPVLEVQYNNFGILSLTADPKSLPMWAYYGDSHKGMCVGLRSSNIAKHQNKLLQHSKLLMLHKVYYTNEIPKICIDINPNGMSREGIDKLETTLYTKSQQWDHEQEYRLVFHQHSSEKYIFGSDSVAEILVGLRASDEDIDTLIKELRKSNSNAIVKRAIQSQSKYALEFEEIHI